MVKPKVVRCRVLYRSLHRHKAPWDVALYKLLGAFDAHAYCKTQLSASMWTVIMAEENVAYGKLCNQSSYTGSESAFLAVDGNFKTCFKSNYIGYQWMSVDLLWKYNVQSVTLHGVLTSDYLQVFLTNVEDIRSETYLTINCSLVSNGFYTGGKISKFNCLNESWNMMRYLFIVQSKLSSYRLVICEIDAIGSWAEISPRRDNVLYKKPITNFINSSIIKLSKAVDGIRDTDSLHGFCYIELNIQTYYHWLKIDMLENYIIDYGAITAKIPAISRIYQISHIIGFTEDDFSPVDWNNYPVCAYLLPITPGTRVTFQCNANLPAYRFLLIHQIISTNFFSMCEVEAYATLNKNSKIWKLAYRNQRVKLDYSIKEMVSSTAAQCSLYCGNYNGDSFSYNAQKQLCQINKHKSGLLPSSLVEKYSSDFLIHLETIPMWNTWISVYA